MTDFSERLSSIMEKTDVSGAQLSRFLGITKQEVSNWTTGKSKPDHDTLLKLASIFHVSTDYLLGNAALPSDDVMKVRFGYLSPEEGGNNDNAINEVSECLKQMSPIEIDYYLQIITDLGPMQPGPNSNILYKILKYKGLTDESINDILKYIDMVEQLQKQSGRKKKTRV